jgi:hypothetical protein
LLARIVPAEVGGAATGASGLDPTGAKLVGGRAHPDEGRPQFPAEVVEDLEHARDLAACSPDGEEDAGRPDGDNGADE